MENLIIKNIFGQVVKPNDKLFDLANKQKLVNLFVQEICINSTTETLDSTIVNVLKWFKARLPDMRFKYLEEMFKSFVIPACHMNIAYYERFLKEKSPESVLYLKDLINIINKDIDNFNVISHSDNFITRTINSEMIDVRRYSKDNADMGIKIYNKIDEERELLNKKLNDSQKTLNSIYKKVDNYKPQNDNTPKLTEISNEVKKIQSSIDKLQFNETPNNDLSNQLLEKIDKNISMLRRELDKFKNLCNDREELKEKNMKQSISDMKDFFMNEIRKLNESNLESFRVLEGKIDTIIEYNSKEETKRSKYMYYISKSEPIDSSNNRNSNIFKDTYENSNDESRDSKSELENYNNESELSDNRNNDIFKDNYENSNNESRDSKSELENSDNESIDSYNQNNNIFKDEPEDSKDELSNSKCESPLNESSKLKSVHVIENDNLELSEEDEKKTDESDSWD